MSGLTPEDIPELCDRLEKAVVEAKKKKSLRSQSFGELEFKDWRKERPFLDSSSIPDLDEHEDEQTTGESVVDQLLTYLIGGQQQSLIVHSYKTSTDDVKPARSLIGCSDPIETEYSSKCLKLVQCYSLVASFVEDQYFLSQGRVNGALAGGIDCILQDYQSLVVVLEKMHRRNKFSVPDLWFRVQDVTETFKVLSDLIIKLAKSNSRGAATLSLIHEFTLYLTVPNLEKKICVELTKEAAAPYMESVQKWVFNGEIDDPFDEFMVIEHFTLASKDEWKKMEEYWEKKYQIRKACVPVFLKKLETKILNAGKYLNVIKECVSSERDFKLAPIEEINYDENESYINIIDRAYGHSSKLLLDYMLNEHKIKERVISLKRYFLLEQGDFVVQLLDTCDDELMKETSEILPSRLTTLVEMAIRIPSTNDDPYRDEIRMSLQKHTLSEQVNKIFGETKDASRTDEPDGNARYDMTGYESFTLSINCEWPVSLILHSKIVSSYQMLFRHLFYCKYIERILCRVWNLNQTKGLPFLEARTYANANALAHKMMIFVQNMEYYMMEVAIESHWMDFMQNFDSIPNVDDLISEHWKFLDLSMKDCLLGDNALFKIFRVMLADFLEFGHFTIAIKSSTETNRYPTFSERINQLNNQFEENLTKFYNALQEASVNDTSSKLVNLFIRLKQLFNKEE